MNNVVDIFTHEMFGTVTVLLDDNNDFLFVAKEIARILDYASPDKMYKRICDEDKIKINPHNAKSLENAGLSNYGVSQIEQNPNVKVMILLTEPGLYDAIYGSEKKEAKEFRYWVSHNVLPSLRKNRCYILEDATEEQVTFNFLYGKEKLKKTFMETTDVNVEYDRFKKLSKERRDRDHHSYSNQCRINDCKTIIKILEDRARERVLTASPSEIMAYQELISKIQIDITSLTNQRQGGIKAQITRKLNKLRTDYDSLVFELNTVKNEYQQVLDQNEELRLQDIGADIPFTVIEKHGFSNNKMYKPRGNQMKRTADYNAYENSFPKYQLRNPSFLGHLDFTKPICCELKFAHIETYDVHNFIKPTLDIVSRAINCDDKIIRKVMCSTESYVDDYKDGRIYIKLYNI